MYKKKKVPSKLYSEIMEEPDSPRRNIDIDNEKDISSYKKMIFSPDRMKLYEERKSKIEYVNAPIFRKDTTLYLTTSSKEPSSAFNLRS